MSVTTNTNTDLIDYLVGVYRVLTGDAIAPLMHDDLIPHINKAIDALAPVVAYRLAHLQHKRDTRAQPETAPATCSPNNK